MKRHMPAMQRFTPLAISLSIVALALSIRHSSAAAGDVVYASHPPMRPLPMPSGRPLPNGPAYFVHAQHGDDGNAGSRDAPWKTIAHALRRLKPGDTLCLRAGVYYEPCEIALHGTEDRPITIRGFPGELAIVDAGLRDFSDNPAAAWQPAEDGPPDEYVSTTSYIGLEKVFGNFVESMVPLHGYRNRDDLKSTNEYWSGGGKLETDWSIYCGPGVWYDQTTGRIHCRLAHTNPGSTVWRGDWWGRWPGIPKELRFGR